MAADRLRHVLCQWRGTSIVDRIRDFAASSVILDIPDKLAEPVIPELISRELLIKDEAAESQIREALRASV
jgi:hypothetical protein